MTGRRVPTLPGVPRVPPPGLEIWLTGCRRFVESSTRGALFSFFSISSSPSSASQPERVSPPRGPGSIGGLVIRVDEQNGVARTALPGPASPFNGRALELPIVARIDRARAKVTLELSACP